MFRGKEEKLIETIFHYCSRCPGLCSFIDLANIKFAWSKICQTQKNGSLPKKPKISSLAHGRTFVDRRCRRARVFLRALQCYRLKVWRKPWQFTKSLGEAYIYELIEKYFIVLLYHITIWYTVRWERVWSKHPTCV